MSVSWNDYMKNIAQVLKSTEYVKTTDIPNIDLYMDQVTTFMDEYLESSKRFDSDKLLTKTMINNYTKNDLLPPPEKKKYTKDHMFLLIFIYYLKSFLSIRDVKTIIEPMAEMFYGRGNEDINLESIYESIFNMEYDASFDMAKDVINKYRKSRKSFEELENDKEKDYLQIFAFIAMLSFDVYMKKNLIEKIIDEVLVNEPKEEEKDNKEKTRKSNPEAGGKKKKQSCFWLGYNMKKGSIVTGTIEYTEFPNKGFLFTEGERVTIKGTIAGQKVTGAVNKGRKGKFEARLLEVNEKSPLETCEPECPHFGTCGGCFYQTLTSEDQLKVKAGHVKSLLDKVIDYDYEFEAPLPSPKHSEYRNKMEFTFGNEYKDGPLVLGLHKKGSFYDIVPVKDCKLISEDLRKVLATVQDWALASGFSFLHKVTKEGYFRHLLVRQAAKNGGILIDLVTTTQPGPDLSTLVESLLDLNLDGEIKGILNTVNDSLADVVKDEGTTILYGQDYIEEELLGLSFKISPFSFFQTNSLGAEVLYTAAREYIMESYYDGDAGEMRGATIYDLYSGTGTIGQMMAPVCGQVIGVEIVEEAVEAAKVNAKRNGLDNCTFLAGDVLKVIDEIEDKPDYIILDPPREGIHPKAIGKIINYGVDSLVYISCKPSSLANDLLYFHEAGYKVTKVRCVDMFEKTPNIETIALIQK